MTYKFSTKTAYYTFYFCKEHDKLIVVVDKFCYKNAKYARYFSTGYVITSNKKIILNEISSILEIEAINYIERLLKLQVFT